MGKQSRPNLACAVYVVLHVAAHLSASLFEVSDGISIWYPPCGLALSLLVLLGPRYAPVVFCTNLLSAWFISGFDAWWAPFVFPGLITLNYTAAAWVARRFLGTVLLPGSPRATFIFSAVIVGSAASTALSGTGVLLALGMTTPDRFLHAAIEWWVGDVSGLLTIVPAIMVFAGPWVRGEARGPLRPQGAPPLAASLLQGIVLLGCLALVFGLEPLRRYNAFYLCFLPLIWICLRQGLPGATLATLAITMAGLMAIHFVGSSPYLVTNFLLFELAIACVGLGLGAAVSRRDQAERDLASSESRFERVIDGAQLGVWDWNLGTQDITHNRRYAEMLGWPYDQLRTSFGSWEQLLHPADRDRVKLALSWHLQGLSPLYEIEYRMRTPDQRWRWMLSRGSIVSRDRYGQPQQVSGTHIDITDRKRAEAETRRLIQVLEASTDFTVITDSTGAIHYANTALRRLAGDESTDLKNRSLLERFTPSSALKARDDAIPTALASGMWQGELALLDPHGGDIPVSQVLLAHRDEETDTVMLSFIMRDISRQKQAEAERIENERKMLQLQKLESLGVLAGGIAHDFNNLLTPMMGYASLARLDLPEESPVQSSLGKIETAATRAAELCQQMLAYAGRSPLAFAQVNLSDLIEDTVQLLELSAGKKGILKLKLARPGERIMADATQMRQIVMNLVLNASEALGENEGTVTVRTCTRTLDSSALRGRFHGPAPAEGRYVVLEVEDTGCGMSEEVQARMFEPFYSTKFTGHGLGLAAVLGIVKSHHGAIQVESTPGKGSLFRLFFPALENTADDDLFPSDETQEWRGSGTILVVDDEPGVRDVVSRALELFGFDVLTAADGIEAVNTYREHRGALRCVLLDLTMPRMDGEQAFQEMHKIDNSVPVILMSGYSEKLSLERFANSKPAGFIPKPFNYKTLQSSLEPLIPQRT